LAPIGSLTKAFTATSIGELVAEGKMDWDTTPVNKYLPEFELKDPVLTSQLTLVDLLSHRTVHMLDNYIMPARYNLLVVEPLLIQLRVCRVCRMSICASTRALFQEGASSSA
jgi:CubicO group peptidase (beta-lactamase class C family)